MPDPRASAGLRMRRRAVRSLGFALPLTTLALVAAGCGASLGGRYDSATTMPRAVSAPAAGSGTLRVVSAQPLPALDPAFATTRQARAVANALCTPLVRYADAEGLAGTVIVPGLARDLPIVGRGSRSFRVQLLTGLQFADGRPLTSADVQATFERLLDPATRSPGAALFSDLAGLRGVRGGHVSAPQRRAREPRLDDVHAQALRPGVPGAPGDADRLRRAGAARRTARCRACSRQDSTGRYRVVEHTGVADRSRARAGRAPPCRTAAARAPRRTSRSRACRMRRRCRARSAPALPTSRSTTSRTARRRPLRCRRRRSASCASTLRAGRSPTSTCAARSRLRSTGACSRDRTAAMSCPRARCCSIRRRPRALPADPAAARALLRSAGAEDTSLERLGRAGRAGAPGAGDREPTGDRWA